MNPVTTGMMEDVGKKKRTVEDYTSATSAKRRDIKERSVESDPTMKHPKYLERSVWTDADMSPSFSLTVCCTLTDRPLPCPSPNEFLNTDAMNTIHNNPHLFKIVTPINVLKFESLLESHPNKPFIQSICTSLHEGFWPGPTHVRRNTR